MAPRFSKCGDLLRRALNPLTWVQRQRHSAPTTIEGSWCPWLNSFFAIAVGVGGDRA
jgi:hypothetical protein